MRKGIRNSHDFSGLFLKTIWLAGFTYLLAQLIAFIIKLTAVGAIISTGALILSAFPISLTLVAVWTFKKMHSNGFSLAYSISLIGLCAVSSVSTSLWKLSIFDERLISLFSLLSSILCLTMVSYHPVRYFYNRRKYFTKKDRLLNF